MKAPYVEIKKRMKKMNQTDYLNINKIKLKIRQFIIENFLFGSDENNFNDNDSFLEISIIDSTGIFELIEFIEVNYRIKAKDDELIPENFDSLDNVSAYIMEKIG